MKLCALTLSHRFCRIAVSLAACGALLCIASPSKADTFYYNTGGLSIVETNLTLTPDGGNTLWTTSLAVTNTTAQQLTNVYLFTDYMAGNTVQETLSGPGDYSASPLFSDAVNASVFITPSQTDILFDADDQGSLATAEIPGFLVADVMAPGQTVDMDIDFVTDPSTTYLQFGVAATTTPTPEPSSLALLTTGLLGTAGVLRRRFV